MDMASIVGALIGAAATRIYGAGVAIWVALEVSEPLKSALGTVEATLTSVNAIH